ncbi:MAG: amidohydrolase family protein [Candidatus Bathyarchaeia archaeon]
MHTHIAGGFSEQFAREWLQTHWAALPAWWDPSRRWRVEDFTNIDPGKGITDMDRGRVNVAVTWGIRMTPLGCNSKPEHTARLQEKYAGRVIGFHCADAFKGGTEAARDLERAVNELSLRGVKIFPSYNHMYPNDPRLMPIYAKAEELNVPCVVHAALALNKDTWVKYEHPFHLDEVCQAHPDLKLVVAHFGFQFAEEVLTLMWRYPNLYGDLAAFAFWPIHYLAHVFAWAKKLGFHERIVFGSDWPLGDPAAQIEVYRRLPTYMEKYGYEPALTEEDVAKILGGNAAKLLKL